MTTGTNISRAAIGGGVGRRLLVALLFSLTLALLALAGLIIIPEPTGFYDPDGGLRNLAMISALAMVVVALPDRDARIMLGILLGGLGVFLLILTVADVSFRFIAQSDEGEFSMTMIALLVSAPILFFTAAVGSGRTWARPGTVKAGTGAPSRHEIAAASGGGWEVRDYLNRVLWSTPQRRGLVQTLAVFYMLVAMGWLVSSAFDGGGLTIDDLGGLAINGGIAAVAAFIASRASNPTLKAALWVVTALFVFGSVLGTGLGLISVAIALHAGIAFIAFAASAAAADARTDRARAGYTMLAVLAVVVWGIMLLYGILIAMLAASGYES